MTFSHPIQGVLFDMDDTLIDWSGFTGDWADMDRQHLQSVYAYFAEKGRSLDTTLDQFALAYRDRVVDAWASARTTLRAPNMGTILEETLGSFNYLLDDTITLEGCLKAFGWAGAPGVRVFPDVPNALQHLMDRGLVLGILTNAMQPMWIRDFELERYDLLHYFPDVEKRMSAADVGYLKPHRRIFEEALKRMGTAAENTIYVGDNPVADIAGAQAAGMHAVLRVNRPAPPLISGLVVPDAAINSLDELLLLLDMSAT